MVGFVYGSWYAVFYEFSGIIIRGFLTHVLTTVIFFSREMISTCGLKMFTWRALIIKNAVIPGGYDIIFKS